MVLKVWSLNQEAAAALGNSLEKYIIRPPPDPVIQKFWRWDPAMRGSPGDAGACSSVRTAGLEPQTGFLLV